MSSAQRGGDRVWVFEEGEDAADGVSFEAAQRLGGGLAGVALFGDVGGGFAVVGEFAEREHVDGVVELAVAAAVEAVAAGVARADGDRGAAGDPGEFGVGGEPVDPGD